MRRPGLRTVLIPDHPPVLRFCGLEPPFAVRVVAGWDGLAGHLRSAHPSTVALVDPYGGRADGPLAPELAPLMVRHPSVAFVAAVPFLHPERIADVRTLLDWGVSELVNLDLDTGPRAVTSLLCAAHARPLKRRLEPVLLRYVSQNAITLLRAATEVAVDGGAAPDLAERFGVMPRTVSVWCAREALPPPRRLLAWMRVLLAATLLEDPGRTAAAAARACGYSTDRSLRRAAGILLGPHAAGAGATGLFPAATAALNAELAALRESVRERSRARRLAREHRKDPTSP